MGAPYNKDYASVSASTAGCALREALLPWLARTSAAVCERLGPGMNWQKLVVFQTCGYFFGVPIIRIESILGSILGSSCFGKLPTVFSGLRPDARLFDLGLCQRHSSSITPCLSVDAKHCITLHSMFALRSHTYTQKNLRRSRCCLKTRFSIRKAGCWKARGNPVSHDGFLQVSYGFCKSWKLETLVLVSETSLLATNA